MSLYMHIIHNCLVHLGVKKLSVVQHRNRKKTTNYPIKTEMKQWWTESHSKRKLQAEPWLAWAQTSKFILAYTSIPRPALCDWGGLDTFGSFFCHFTQYITFATFCLLSCTPDPFWKGIYSKRKEFIPLSRREAKTILTESPPVKMYPFDLSI